MRQDPDVILIGEMRDLETVAAALTVAETGHLVLATLHTPDAAQSINRIIDIFPHQQQQQVRTQLSFVIQAVFSQKLLPALGGGRVLATEVLIATAGVRNLIRENKIHQIYTLIQAGRHEGMQTMNHSLAQLYQEGKISYEEAMRNSPDPKELRQLIEKAKVFVR
jgi:twitching motility protein PilT